ncbi:alpha-galactosidase [Allonocardiopsis opalescens]|uniref:alpha-galactosidase n=1 Tax=Allonocardiopsis opalescens TaxID=1144618 RepID=A0A2T0Q1X7_9ACTN|nr:alpha-galactosidase [Allonocardiopsis opalescens]PRX97804.1 alpha-galactosidase [Allonocardiopsis opalescens]
MTSPQPQAEPIAVLRRAGSSLLVDLAPSGGGLPEVLHWGADLGEIDADLGAQLRATAATGVPRSSFDAPRPFTVLPTQADGWSGTLGLSGHLAGTATTPRLALHGYSLDTAGAAHVLLLDLREPGGGLDVELRYALDPHGVLRASASVIAPPEGTGARYDLAALRLLLPLPARAAEVLDLTGAWARERAPQRRELLDGTLLRRSLRGRPGHDSPLLLVAGTHGFGFRSGEVWGVHVAWSGGAEYLVERLPERAGAHAAVLGGAEAVAPGEVRLAPGERYDSPDLVFCHSEAGLDGLSERLHGSLRARPEHPASPRPVVLNTWEAVYFDHDIDRLRALADRAARVGVGRFVLDDGWFRGRRDATAGLGDWRVDPVTWPDGLGPLAEHVTGLGMEFGLWVEPEMVNPDSDLARAHPDWLLHPPGAPGRAWRHQYVLDLGREDAWRYVHDALTALLDAYPISYLKWDHNRDLHEAVHASPSGPVPGVRRQTEALYALLGAVRARHPGVEIESCASGGARVDLGILRHTQRVWASDCNDPLERQTIQRWTGLLLPPELVGAHVGPPVAHSTGRAADLSFRLATALFGHPGIEWDITGCDETELAALTAWTALYRELRPLLHGGRTVRADETDPSAALHGVVARDGGHALFCLAQLDTSGAAQPGRTPLPGLDPDRRYRVRARTELGEPVRFGTADPAWLRPGAPEPVLTGRALGALGLPLPRLAPQQALLLEVRAAD